MVAPKTLTSGNKFTRQNYAAIGGEQNVPTSGYAAPQETFNVLGVVASPTEYL